VQSLALHTTQSPTSQTPVVVLVVEVVVVPELEDELVDVPDDELEDEPVDVPDDELVDVPEDELVDDAAPEPLLVPLPPVPCSYPSTRTSAPQAGQVPPRTTAAHAQATKASVRRPGASTAA